MKVVWNDMVIAEAPQEQLIRIEGNWYFPPSSLKREYFSDSDHKTTCFWKGEANYYDVTVDNKVNEFGAWYYPEPKDAAKQIAGRVAFWKGVTVSD